MINLNKRQARQFMLLKHGLLGEHKFYGKQGAFDFIRQSGCIQFDPVDLCGKNAEITLQARVKDFNKEMLAELLYTDRKLFDYPDKQLSIIPTDDWAYFERFRKAAREHVIKYPEIHSHINQVRSFIEENGAVCSDDLKLEGNTRWWSAINWSAGSNISRSVLEQMYSAGELIVHHKKGTRRYYDLAEKHISAGILNQAEPLPDDFEHKKWRILRRIGAVGLLWNRSSDAFLNIWGLKTDERNEAFRQLFDEGKISAVSVEDIKDILYFHSEDITVLETVLQSPEIKPRCEFIAPLDPFMWDRKLIKALFGFEYSWEIYTQPHKRKYGAYVLPVIFGDNIIGRIEAAAERKSQTLAVKNIWYEDGVKKMKKLQEAINGCMKRFAKFNSCDTVAK